MKKIIILSILSLFIVPFVFAEDSQGLYTLTNCVDSDGDKPSQGGDYSWNYEDVSGNRGWGNSADSCSFHYWYVLHYSGEEIKLGESILVEGVCPAGEVGAEQPGEIQQQIQKFYKCECDNKGSSGEKGTENNAGYCKNIPEEIPSELVYEAMKNGKMMVGLVHLL